METNTLEKKLNYTFKDKSLLLTALTHSSKINEDKSLTSNERLEFLGDAVLSLVIGDYLYLNTGKESEGVLTKLRALIVCADSLSIASKKIDLGSYLLMGKGEIASGGKDKKNIAADSFEALIGAIYLDAGYEKVREISLRLLDDIIKKALEGKLAYDFKTVLQEYVHANSMGNLSYTLLKVEGPEHAQIFTSRVKTDDKHTATGRGTNKKDSEQQAAHNMLKDLKLL